MKVGFIGLGNVGGKLARNILRNGFPTRVLDLDRALAEPLLSQGAQWADTPAELARESDMTITCLPTPSASAEVMEGENGALAALGPGKLWAEMSTTDAEEVRRLGAKVAALGAEAVDCPVSGGCHRAATGNIAIFVGGERAAFERALPVVKVMGRRILHAGPLGAASVLKVVTNYLASAHLIALGEAFAAASREGMDLTATFEAIRISSGNSFVHETEGRVILNGSRNINFTMDLVVKDMSLFVDIAERGGLDLELAPLLLDILRDGEKRYGPREWSANIVRRLEEKFGMDFRAPGFPAELVDDEPEAEGCEVIPAKG